jgi:hypothetical protein
VEESKENMFSLFFCPEDGSSRFLLNTGSIQLTSQDHGHENLKSYAEHNVLSSLSLHVMVITCKNNISISGLSLV